jgi:hypothetical protein
MKVKKQRELRVTLTPKVHKWIAETAKKIGRSTPRQAAFVIESAYLIDGGTGQ